MISLVGTGRYYPFGVYYVSYFMYNLIMNKTCYICGVEKDISEMWYSRNRYRCHQCKANKNIIIIKSTVNQRNLKRKMIRDYIRIEGGITNDNPVYIIIGCTPVELKDYLTSKFTEGMTWELYGFHGWHIDHKVPLSSGHTNDELNSLCYYTNLQPLWESDNLRKSGKKTF